MAATLPKMQNRFATAISGKTAEGLVSPNKFAEFATREERKIKDHCDQKKPRANFNERLARSAAKIGLFAASPLTILTNRRVMSRPR